MPAAGGLGAWKERGAGQTENRGAGRDIPTPSQKEESGVGARDCGEAALLLINALIFNLVV